MDKNKLIKHNLFDVLAEKMFFTDPVGYLDMITLESNAVFIATDSGGVQKEAFFYKKPCITLRDETEWVELEHLGWNKIVSPQNQASEMFGLTNNFLQQFDPKNKRPYGNGNSSELIIKSLLEQVD